MAKKEPPVTDYVSHKGFRIETNVLLLDHYPISPQVKKAAAVFVLLRLWMHAEHLWPLSSGEPKVQPLYRVDNI